MNVKMQLTVFGALLLVNVLLAFATYMWMPFEQLGMGAELPAQLNVMPRCQMSSGMCSFPCLVCRLGFQLSSGLNFHHHAILRPLIEPFGGIQIEDDAAVGSGAAQDVGPQALPAGERR
jgi:hypothetical protein